MGARTNYSRKNAVHTLCWCCRGEYALGRLEIWHCNRRHLYEIVKQLHGHISVRSETNRGSTFDVYWPRAQVAMIERNSAEPEPPLVSRHLTILFVEDDSLVRKVTAKMLQRLGHDVFVADSGAAALEIADNSGPFDLLVTDVVMPWINGRELYNLLVARYPRLNVVYISGYTDNVILRKGVVKSDVTLVRKPFSEEELQAAIQNVMRAGELAG